MSRLAGVILSIIIISLALAVACARPQVQENQQLAEEYVKLDSTFRFDSIPGTMKTTETTSVANGWKYTIAFDSRYAGYGNRTGQMLLQIITHHTAKVTVQNGKVTLAVMDGVWDMINQQMLNSGK